MKKITFKITTFLLLSMFVFQTQGQISESKIYTLKNKATGNYLTPSMVDGENWFVPDASYSAYNQHFTFVSTTYSGNAVFNIVSRSSPTGPPGGAMRGAGSGADWKVFNTLVAAPTADNSHSDKVWLLDGVNISNPAAMEYRFSNRTGTRWLYEDASPAMPDLTYITSDINTDDRSIWIVEEATILSADEFDNKSIFITNPVNNQLDIKGLPTSVKQITVYSLLGKEVLTREVNTQSSLNIDVSTLKSGMYLVKMQSDNAVFTKKILKQ